MSKISSKFHNLRNKISKLNKKQNNKTESSPLVTIFVNDIKYINKKRNTIIEYSQKVNLNYMHSSSARVRVWGDKG